MNCSVKVCFEMLVVNLGLFVEVICTFDQFLMGHIDGKYRNATAPLVLICIGYVVTDLLRFIPDMNPFSVSLT